jgi:hypothetical protein
MKLITLVMLSLICNQCVYAQKLGFQDFLVGNKLTEQVYDKYKITPHAINTNTLTITYLFDAVQFCTFGVDTVRLSMDHAKRVKSILVQTKYVELDDFRSLNYEWENFLQCLVNDYGSPYKVGENIQNRSVVAIWIFSQNVWLTVSTFKMFPGQKNEQRRFEARWERRPAPATFFH